MSLPCLTSVRHLCCMGGGKKTMILTILTLLWLMVRELGSTMRFEGVKLKPLAVRNYRSRLFFLYSIVIGRFLSAWSIKLQFYVLKSRCRRRLTSHIGRSIACDSAWMIVTLPCTDGAARRARGFAQFRPCIMRIPVLPARSVRRFFPLNRDASYSRIAEVRIAR